MRKLSLFFTILLFTGLVSAATVVEEIVAKVGNDIITKSDYDRELARMREEIERHLQGEERDKALAAQEAKLLDFMINQKLLEQRAKDLNISVEEEVTAAVKQLREENQIPDDQTLDSALKREGSSLQQLREDFRRRLIQQRILWNYVQSKVNITEEQIKNYYDQHQSEMMSDPTVKIRRYTVASDSTDKETLHSEANNALSRLREGGQVTAEEFPHTKGDDKGLEFTKAEIEPKLVETIETTPAGSFTEPIEIANGWLILNVEERKESAPLPLEEARGRIYNLLLQQNSEKYQQSFLDDLRKQSYVIITQKNP